MKKLHELLSFQVPLELRHMIVNDICDNSQKVMPGNMFVALRSYTKNEKNYIDEAILRGARYIVLQRKENYVEVKNEIIFIFVKNTAIELAHIASQFFSSNFDNIIAVTGTNGKSSTVDIARQIWIMSNIDSASIGTLGVITKEKCDKLSNNLTSPGALELHKIFNKLSNNGIKNIVIEASSHGIDQNRIDKIPFSVCAFTNLTQDHLDYHKTLENYWLAKERLFSELATEETVFVVNSDDVFSERIYKISEKRKIKCVNYGYSAKDIKIIKLDVTEQYQNVNVSFFGKEFSFSIKLHGEFQIYNSLCAAAICYFTGIKIDDIVDALSKLQPVNGRLELVAKTNSANIYIDYAHTPDALKNAVLSLRKHTKNRIITVFGCGGNRDQQKRILMGEIAEKNSDIVIVTDDNPRNEDPAIIRKMILSGCVKAIEIADRKIAIESAIAMLEDGDSLLVAGKGHENYQQIGSKLVDFSDKEIILNRIK